ncbi:hypothetical protein N9824_00575 [bacterium]|nr:hypothetical protein [bacterium]
MKEVKCYKFWEQNFNPITMQKNDDKVSSINRLTAAGIQEADERAMAAVKKKNANTRTKIVSRFW